MKIDNTIPPYQPSHSKITSPGGSFAEQLQQLTQAQGNNADPRAQKMREIAGKYDLDRLSYTQCEKMVNELCVAGVIDMHEASLLVPVELTVTADGGRRSEKELDSMIVDPRQRMATIHEQDLGQGKDKQAAQSLKLLKFYDELLATFREIKGKPHTLSTRA